MLEQEYSFEEVDSSLIVDGKTHTFKAVRLTGFGQDFQEVCRSPEWRAAYTVYTKYKRKYSLKHPDLVQLRNYIVDWSAERQKSDKKINLDILIQECSQKAKELWQTTTKEISPI